MKHIKLFENFSRDYLKANNNSLVSFYSEKLKDFSLETTLLEELAKLESQVDETFSDGWDLNRGRSYGKYNGDYFALNVKVHVWVDTDTVKEEIGIELDEDRLNDIWWRWLQDQAEMFEEDIKESYSWVENVSWGGNSGGWIHIYPELGADQILEYAEDEIQQYLDTKEYYDEEEIASIANTINNPEWKRLAELGLVDDERSVNEITTKLNECIKYISLQSAQLREIEVDLRSIQQQHKGFEQKAERYFLDFLKDEVTGGYIRENVNYTNISESGQINIEDGIQIDIFDGDLSMGSVGLIELNLAKEETFDPNLAEFSLAKSFPFTNENSYYIHSMWINEAYRGRGLSKVLMAKCNEIAKRAGIKYLTLITSKDNIPAQNLYRNQGYSVYESSEIKDLFYKEL